MTLFPTWGLGRLLYWIIFALIVLSIERVIGNRNWDMFGVIAENEKTITAITLLGIALLFIWAIFH
jgi:hypothetical protein